MNRRKFGIRVTTAITLAIYNAFVLMGGIKAEKIRFRKHGANGVVNVGTYDFRSNCIEYAKEEVSTLLVAVGSTQSSKNDTEM